ncbi:fibrinogen C domain-containing protein 1-like isoform X2 [Anthonomus grandis grandis]|uniref:fibrinogen C domain-containing protein 1-like isoform X2 n=1 Tax=Anthonomus grandis grandis TaxID=2921223 RepID=UPI0021650788|nr:fibrinogen C domain-containing protein 1-like isoform X2 [Anthonomus grandis grandis]
MTFLLGVLGVIVSILLEAEGATTERNSNLTPPTRQQCDLSLLENRLQLIEEHLNEKFNGLRRDIWSSSRSIEQQTAATRNVVEELRRGIERLRRDPHLQSQSTDLSQKLERELQTVILSLRLLTSEVAVIRENVSKIVNSTNAMKDRHNIESNIQQIFKPSSSNAVPSNCQEIRQNNPGAASSIYLVHPRGSNESFFVYCDMEAQGGGWLTIHNRFTGEQDFYLDWLRYKIGFGNVAGEHWLGLEHIYEITGKEIHELLIQLVDVNNVKTYAHYSHFSLGSEEEGYPLKVLGGYTGTAGDSLSYHAGSRFSAKDRDEDSWNEGHCAQAHGGAWWYKSCDKSNLNGKYLPGPQPDMFAYQPMYWDTFTGPQTGLKYARMMVRPRQEVGETLTSMRM